MHLAGWMQNSIPRGAYYCSSGSDWAIELVGHLRVILVFESSLGFGILLGSWEAVGFPINGQLGIRVGPIIIYHNIHALGFFSLELWWHVFYCTVMKFL